MKPARVLVVAGRDSSGRAGLAADGEALRLFGAEPLCVVSTETVQEGLRVRSVRPRPVADWVAQVRSLEAEASVWKSGLLYGAEAVAAFARLAAELLGDRPLVFDPVIAATGGERFLDEAGVACLREVLLPTGPILTPNLGEAAELCGMEKELLQTDFDSRIEAAERLLEMGAVAVLLKGGHGTEDPVRDLVLERGSEPLWRSHERVRGGSMRGSGCRYGSAVAALLALGQPLSEAARRAGEELVKWIRRAKFCAAEGSR
jgi:hydroxymethylpyrimidine/phosphomethylpyrimidine kinase